MNKLLLKYRLLINKELYKEELINYNEFIKINKKLLKELGE